MSSLVRASVLLLVEIGIFGMLEEITDNLEHMDLSPMTDIL